MWLQKNQWDRKDGVNGIVAVAIDSDKSSQNHHHGAKSGAIDKGSQNALKWAIDHLLTKGSTIALIHVNVKTTSFSGSSSPSISTPSEYY